MENEEKIEEQEAEVVESKALQLLKDATILVTGKVSMDKDVIEASRATEAALSKRSIEFIGGKRRIALSSIHKKARKKAFLMALVKCHGVISDACKAAGVARTTVYGWVDRDPEFAQALNVIEDESIDFAESMLFKNIARGYEASIIFFLKTRGRGRGYDEQGKVRNQSKLEELIRDNTDDELEQQIRALEAKINAANGGT